MAQGIFIDPSILRLVWSIATNIRSQGLFTLPDQELHEHILREVNYRSPLDESQQGILLNYLHSRMMLIRDLAGAY